MSYQEYGPKFALAIDKGHNIIPDEVDFLQRAGFNFRVWENGTLHVVVENDPYLRSITLSRGGDIPYRLEENVAEFGILGRDVLREAQLGDFEIEEVVPLGISRCRLVVEVPINSQYTKPVELNYKRVATSHPNQAIEYFVQNNADIKIIRYGGGEEGAPASGAADAVIAIYRSGTAMRENDLRLLNTLKESTLLESEAVLVASTEFLDEHGNDRIVKQFISRVRQTAGTRAIKRAVRPVLQMSMSEITLATEIQVPQIA